MNKSPRNLIDLLDSNQKKFFKSNNLNFEKLLDSLNIKDIRFTSESEYNDNNYYTLIKLNSLNEIPVSFDSAYDFEDNVSMENCNKLLKLMMKRSSLDFHKICKSLSLESLNLTVEEIGESEFSLDEIWLVSFSVLTKNDPEDIFDFINFVNNLSPDLIPYKYK